MSSNLGIISRIVSATPNDADPANRRKALSAAGQLSGKVWIQVPQGGSALLVKFGSAGVAIDETNLTAETLAFKLEVGASSKLNTRGAAYVDVYSASLWEVNIHEVDD